VNIGTGKDISIYELSNLIKRIVGFEGDVRWDKNMPNGTERKLMDVSKLKQIGWSSSIDLENGIVLVYNLIKNLKWQN